MQCILPAHTRTNTHTGSRGNDATSPGGVKWLLHWAPWDAMQPRLSMEEALHRTVRSCCPEPQVSTAVRLLQTCQRSLLPAFQVLHFLQTQNEWTLLLFKYEQTQAKREEMENHFPTGKKQERLFTLSLTTLQYSLAFPSLWMIPVHCWPARNMCMIFMMKYLGARCAHVCTFEMCRRWHTLMTEG